MKRNKRDGQKIHAMRRAAERYGVELTGKDLQEMALKIVFGQAQFVSRETNRVTKHVVNHRGTNFLVAYDKIRKSICSVLPPQE